MTSHFEKRKTGRPALVFVLSEEAARYFPQNYDRLAAGVLRELSEMSGREKVRELLERRCDRMEKDYLEQMEGETDPVRRAGIIAKIRDEEGYMAEGVTDDDGVATIVEHNCPISSIAKEFPEVCQMELELFERVTGSKVERTQHMVKGSHACVYRLHSNGSSGADGNGSETASVSDGESGS